MLKVVQRHFLTCSHLRTNLDFHTQFSHSIILIVASSILVSTAFSTLPEYFLHRFSEKGQKKGQNRAKNGKKEAKRAKMAQNGYKNAPKSHKKGTKRQKTAQKHEKGTKKQKLETNSNLGFFFLLAET